VSKSQPSAAPLLVTGRTAPFLAGIVMAVMGLFLVSLWVNRGCAFGGQDLPIIGFFVVLLFGCAYIFLARHRSAFAAGRPEVQLNGTTRSFDDITLLRRDVILPFFALVLVKGEDRSIFIEDLSRDEAEKLRLEILAHCGLEEAPPEAPPAPEAEEDAEGSAD
jgi:hypothetical protein